MEMVRSCVCPLLVALALAGCGPTPVRSAPPSTDSDGWRPPVPGPLTLEAAVVGLRGESKQMWVGRTEPLVRSGLAGAVLESLPAAAREKVDAFERASGMEITSFLEGVVWTSNDIEDAALAQPAGHVLCLAFLRGPITRDLLAYLNQIDDDDDDDDDDNDDDDRPWYGTTLAGGLLAPVTPEARAWLLAYFITRQLTTFEVLGSGDFIAILNPRDTVISGYVYVFSGGILFGTFKDGQSPDVATAKRHTLDLLRRLDGLSKRRVPAVPEGPAMSWNYRAHGRAFRGAFTITDRVVLNYIVPVPRGDVPMFADVVEKLKILRRDPDAIRTLFEIPDQYAGAIALVAGASKFRLADGMFYAEFDVPLDALKQALSDTDSTPTARHDCDAAADHVFALVTDEHETMLEALPPDQARRAREQFTRQVPTLRAEFLTDCEENTTPAVLSCIMRARSFEQLGPCYET